MYDKALLPSNTFLVLPVNQSNILKVTVRKKYEDFISSSQPSP